MVLPRGDAVMLAAHAPYGRALDRRRSEGKELALLCEKPFQPVSARANDIRARPL